MEYGGYIEFEYYRGREYHKNAIALNSGRHCVEYLIKAKKISKMYMPYFMCNSIPDICKKLGVGVEYYHINTCFNHLLDNKIDNNEWLYIINFYGQLSNETIIKLKNKYNNIIIDNAQAFFQKPVDNVDTLYTCRKFFGVSDGGYLYTDKIIQEDLPIDYSYNRMEFLLGRFEKSANEFYSQYVENNQQFAKEPLKRMSKLTHNLLKSIDYTHINKIRTENFKLLHNMLMNRNKLNLNIPKGAFMYPLYIENGAEIRKKLQEKKIYIPTLWPNVFDVCNPNDLEYDMATNILPLPVDQRYATEDMNFIVKEIEKCIV